MKKMMCIVLVLISLLLLSCSAKQEAEYREKYTPEVKQVVKEAVTEALTEQKDSSVQVDTQVKAEVKVPVKEDPCAHESPPELVQTIQKIDVDYGKEMDSLQSKDKNLFDEYMTMSKDKNANGEELKAKLSERTLVSKEINALEGKHEKKIQEARLKVCGG